MLQIINHENGIIIRNDEAVLEKAQQGNGNIPIELTSIEGLRVDVDVLVKLFDKAERTGPIYDGDKLAGYPIAKQYAALRQRFIEQAQLAAEQLRQMKEEQERRKASGFDGITSSNSKPVNAE